MQVDADVEFCQRIMSGEEKIPHNFRGTAYEEVVLPEDFVAYEDMTYVEIETVLEKLRDLDERHELGDRELTKWEEHDAAEFNTKQNFFQTRRDKTVLDTCDDFKSILSFFGMITLSDRV